MTGPVCPHCGDLTHGCACPPDLYDGDRGRVDEVAWTTGYEIAVQVPGLTDVEFERITHRMYPADQLARIACGEGFEVCRVARRLGEDVAAGAAAGVYGPQLATLCRVANERDQLLRAAVAIRDARRRSEAMVPSGVVSMDAVAMVEAYEAEDAAIVALLALLPDPSPGAGRVES